MQRVRFQVRPPTSCAYGLFQEIQPLFQGGMTFHHSLPHAGVEQFWGKKWR